MLGRDPRSHQRGLGGVRETCCIDALLSRTGDVFMATKARKSARKKAASARKRGTAKKARRMASSRQASSGSRRSTSRRTKSSPVARVKRVTREVVHQAA